VVNTETEYRAYVIGLDGHFIASHGFIAESDDAAFEHAWQFVDGHGIELWSGVRLIAKLKGKTVSRDQDEVSARKVS
jgi:hypothetical protein